MAFKYKCWFHIQETNLHILEHWKGTESSSNKTDKDFGSNIACAL